MKVVRQALSGLKCIFMLCCRHRESQEPGAAITSAEVATRLG